MAVIGTARVQYITLFIVSPNPFLPAKANG